MNNSQPILVPLAKPTLTETIELAKKLKKSITHLAAIYEDRRGNLSESHDHIVDIICCLEGHQRDIQEKIELNYHNGMVKKLSQFILGFI